MIDRKVLREALGWAAIGLALVVVGGLLSVTGASLGTPVLIAGGLVLALCLATLAYELLRD